MLLKSKLTKINIIRHKRETTLYWLTMFLRWVNQQTRCSIKIPLYLELHYHIYCDIEVCLNIHHEHYHLVIREICQYKIIINVRRSFSNAHALATYNETQPPVDRATLVNLARGCNPGRLVSEWRHWRSFDGQLTLTPHPRVIGPFVAASRTISFVSKKLFLHLNGIREDPHDARERSLPGTSARMEQCIRPHKFIHRSALLP